MASSIEANLASWSATEASNKPAGTDTADLDADLRRLQAAVRKYMRSPATPIASGTTVDLATADGDYVSVTGNTQVEALGTVSSGMRFILVFAGTPVIKHNATSLILPGGADITAAAGDVAWVESLGSGNWRCLAYQKADGTPVIKTTTTASISDIAAGTYTPTVTASTGVSSIGTIYDHFYTRVGNLVTIQGRFICTISSTANTTVVVTLPIASNFTNADTDMLGIGHVIGTGVSGALNCVATAATDDFRVLIYPSATGSCNVYYTATYLVK